MKKIIPIIILIGFLCACGSIPPPSDKNPYRPMNDIQKSAVIGSVEARFLAKHVPGYTEDNSNISNMAYIILLAVAKEKYGNNVDVYDIIWASRDSIYDASNNWLGNEFFANGKVISLNTN